MKMSPGIDYTPVKRKVTLVVKLTIGDLDPHEDTRKRAADLAADYIRRQTSQSDVLVLDVGDEESDE